MYIYILGTNIFVSTGTITAIAVDRWFSITRSSPSNQVIFIPIKLIFLIEKNSENI